MKKKLLALVACALCVSMLFACGENNTTEHDHDHETATVSTELADATIEPTYELVDVEGDVTELNLLPVDEYVTLGDYKTLAVSVPKVKEVTETEVEAAAAQYFMEDASYLTADQMLKEGEVVDGGVALIDFEGKLDGVAFEGGTATDYYLGIGSGSFIDGFEEGLVGKKVGETVDLNLKFPENYGSADLAGKEVVFTVTVKAFAPFADEMIAALYPDGYSTVAEYKEAVKFSLEYERQEAYYQALNTALCEQLVGVTEVHKLPKSYYEMQKETLTNNLLTDAGSYGLNGDTFAQYMAGMNLNDYAITTAELYTVQACAFQAVANAEGIEITEEDVDTYVTEYIAMYGEAYGIESEEAFLEFYSRETIKEWILQEQVINTLLETTTVTETE